MSKRCRECLYVNDNTRIFCASCGAPLDAHLRLIQDLEKELNTPREPEKRRGDINIYTSHRPAPQKKSSPLPWVLLGLAVLAVLAAWMLLK